MKIEQWSMWYLSTAAGVFGDAVSEEEANRKADQYRRRHPDKVIEVVRRDYLQVESEPTMIRRMLPKARLKRTNLS